MNKIRFSLIAAGAVLALVAGEVRAQTSLQPTSMQRITFSLVGEYQTNTFYTNTDSPPLTNEYAFIRPVLVTTANVIKAMAVDLTGARLHRLERLGTAPGNQYHKRRRRNFFAQRNESNQCLDLFREQLFQQLHRRIVKRISGVDQ